MKMNAVVYQLYELLS